MNDQSALLEILQLNLRTKTNGHPVGTHGDTLPNLFFA
jgi:hypothetical protein